ncbi:microcin ABC transporter ATP-binding protein [Rhodoblastus sphagnicola]|uniref:Microcin ABC transporter ATP-binding protein n=1 Tax=Rhodoblastus sphagnicola TaxID=333368 RepID=A0A2S6N9M9_9HYPH|nr:ABC transporter ATP-binding protein [Rhodoblastus sphagnicola]MBB4200436.1 microcin C transport system ATP-binding protein [Rhodoblastus sphagnicola]PPQ31309.1 microcin ABC transporter ATP-binding protein [Rhodoblastus sphagnicola]
MDAPLLRVKNLSVSFGDVPAVREASLTLARGKTLGIVGESGSGKSVTALAIVRLLAPGARIVGGSIDFDGQELTTAPENALRDLRGVRIGMVFQEPMTSLNPLHVIEKQIGEALEVHGMASRERRRARVLELLKEVGLQNAEARMGAYPHELSGGQRQRVMIAMALANNPDLLIADEPTTALDVTVQAQILDLLRDLQARHGMAILFITHDLGLVKKMADEVVVMNGGRVVESGATAEIFAAPRHQYTKMLLAAEPQGDPPPADLSAPDVLCAENLRVWFPVKTGLLRRVTSYVKAVDGVSVRLRKGQTLAVVGESGSGKTTLGLALLRLIRSEGPIVFLGQNIDSFSARKMRPLRKKLQVVFQDPYGSLSPRLSVAEIVEEGLIVQDRGLSADERRKLVARALADTGLDPKTMDRYPHEFSGGQRQRIAIARALALDPQVIVLDEPTSALDRSVQAQIVELLRAIQDRRGLSYLFISHDLKVVKALASEIVVLRDGKAIEQGAAADIFANPREKYTQDLFAAAFDIDNHQAKS